jgi:hypothetical protein
MGKKRFPLSIAPAPGGYFMIIALENGQTNKLLRPGKTADSTQPYLFASQQEAWNFVKELLYFCLKQACSQCLHADKILNCKQCRRVFRAKFFDYCPRCMQGNEFMLQQIWQGFYHMTGSESSTMQKVALLLNISKEDFSLMPEAFQKIVQRQLWLHTEMENRAKSPDQQLCKIIKSRPSGLHLSRSPR